MHTLHSFSTYIVEFFRDIFALLLRLFQLLALLQQLRPLDVRHQNRLQRRVVSGHHLLLAVEDVDVWRDLEGAGADVAKQGGFAVAIGANQSIPGRRLQLLIFHLCKIGRKLHEEPQFWEGIKTNVTQR